ncbi:MAG: hypothetical protein AAGB24_09780 [Bacteroidota bacterium]
MDKKVKKKKRIFFGRILRITAFIILGLCLVLGIGLFGLNRYLRSNEEKLFENLPFLNHGSLSFEKVKVSFFKDFPKASIVLKGVKLEDSLASEIGYPVVFFNEVRAGLSLKGWKDRRLDITKIVVNGGEFNINKRSDGYSNLKSVLRKKEGDEQNTTQQPSTAEKPSFLNVNTNDLNIFLQDIDFRLIDDIKTTDIQTKVRSMAANLNIGNGKVVANIDMDVDVAGLTFKKKNGPFLSESHVQGTFDAEIKENTIYISPFDLQVNEHDFLFSGEVVLNKSGPTTLLLENKHTVYKTIAPLLAENLRKAILPYHVDGSFYTKTKLLLNPGHPVKVNIDFDLPENNVHVKDMVFNDAAVKGRFVNRLYDDERSLTEARGNLRILLSSADTKFGAFDIRASDATIILIPKTKAKIKAHALVRGKALGISKWLKNSKFLFEEGDFYLDAQVDGTLDNLANIITKSSAELNLTNTTMRYEPANTVFPFEELTLKKESGQVSFNIVGGTKIKGLNYQLQGGVVNLSALLVDIQGQMATTKVHLRAPKIGWQDFIDLFGKKGAQKERGTRGEKLKKKRLKQTLRGIQQKFGPSLSIALDTVQYLKGLPIRNFKTGAHFENQYTLILEETTFELDKGRISLGSKLDISDPHQTAFEFDLQAQHIDMQKFLPTVDYFGIKLLQSLERHPSDLSVTIKINGIVDDVEGLLPNSTSGEVTFKINKDIHFEGKISFTPDASENASGQAMHTTIDLEGSPHLFNDFFKTEKFIFKDKGKFVVRFNYTGDVASVAHLLNESQAVLTIEDCEVLYVDSNVTFPLKRLALYMERDQASFDIFMRSDSLNRQIDVVGEIDNVTEMVLGNTGKKLQTTFDIRAPKLNVGHMQHIFGTVSEERSEPVKKQSKLENQVKVFLKGLLNRFNPRIHVDIDSLIVTDKLELHNFKTGIVMKDSTFLMLDETGFDFDGGSMQVNAEFDLSSYEEAPFTASLNTKDLNLARFLEGLDYLGSNSLKNTEKLEGRLNLDLAITSSIVDEKLVPAKTFGEIDFDLYDLEIQGLDAIDKIAAKLLAKKRFHDIRFAPIRNTLTLNGKEIQIPQMEIESNALSLFVEGIFSTDERMNIWLSVPTNNLTKKTKNAIPELKGYEDSKSKVYLELTKGEDGKMATKFHLSKRKFYEERGILEQYGTDRKEYRRIRQEKKASKQIDRD